MNPTSHLPPMNDSSTSLVGRLVGGKWKLERVLGVGGMATVYYAVHQHTQRHAAIKVMHQEFVRMEDARQRFSLEARVANRVNHSGVVPVLDDGVLPEGSPYLVMEYIHGQSLQERMESSERRLSIDEVFSIAERLLEILEAAHQAGVLHRDVKPDNVYLTTDDQVKLLDFGISKMSEEAPQSHKTQLGATMGTPAFMSPEQARGRWDELDARADIFAVGAMMYSALTGGMIHQAETSNELLLKVMTLPVCELRKVAPHVPAFAAKVVDRALAFDKKDRFASANEMHLAVHAARAQLSRASFHDASAWLLENREFESRELPAAPAPTDDLWRSRAQVPGEEEFNDEDSDYPTSRPVMFSQFTISTIREGVLYARRKWAVGAVAMLMLATALVSYSLTSDQADDREQSLAPLAAHQAEHSEPEIEAQSATKIPPRTEQDISLSDLQEERPPHRLKKVPESGQPAPHQISQDQLLAAPSKPAPVMRGKSAPPPEEASETASEPIPDYDPLSRRK